MKRRQFVGGLMGTAAWPIVARAQATRNFTVGILASAQRTSPLMIGFLNELNRRGYVEGRNLTIEFRTIAGIDPARIAELAVQLVQASVDIIVVDGTPTALAAKQATTSIPIVMAAIGGDPTIAGLVQSYARPGGNITGFTLVAPELGGKRLQILKEAVQGLGRVGLLWNAANPLNAEPQIKATTDAAAAMGLEIEPGPLRNRDDFASAFEKFKSRRVSAILSVADAFLFAERHLLIELATSSQLPAMFPDRPFASDGGLMVYGPDVLDLFKRAAGYVDRILRGANPGDLPVEQPTRFELVINLQAAKAIGITIPPTLIARADEVIE